MHNASHIIIIDETIINQTFRTYAILIGVFLVYNEYASVLRKETH